jgi:hypothetical protein
MCSYVDDGLVNVVSYSVVWLHVMRTIVTLYRHVEMVVKCAICDMLRPLLGCQIVFSNMYDTKRAKIKLNYPSGTITHGKVSACCLVCY